MLHLNLVYIAIIVDSILPNTAEYVKGVVEKIVKYVVVLAQTSCYLLLMSR